MFSGNVGTGIVIARKPDGGWSPPSAVGVSGLGWGFIVGASVKHLLYLIYDKVKMERKVSFFVFTSLFTPSLLIPIHHSFFFSTFLMQI